MHEHFSMLARYNTLANRSLFEACARLTDEAYRRIHPVSFGSVHALLNHILLGDEIWLSRLESDDVIATPPLDTELCSTFAALQEARVRQDARLESFVASLPADVTSRTVTYINSKGIRLNDPVPLVLAHLFNHQTHHRGQVHVLLSASGIQPPSLDLHRALRPVTPAQAAAPRE